ncbi:MAG: hypothetical protein HY525_18200 [Betaproteobacteria bacterium]|nr:hypothetical protein [Betaproteobacteria bacterium]
MAQNEAVTYRDYTLYPLALYVESERKWQPMVIITRDVQNEDLTLPRSQSFPQVPGLADEEEAALSNALEYGRMLVDGRQQGLTI